MIPLALAASSRRRCFAAAAAAVALLGVVTTIAFGPHVWQAFLDATRFTRVIVLEQGNTGWYKIQSIFAWARMWGGSIPLAYPLQGGASSAVADATRIPIGVLATLVVFILLLRRSTVEHASPTPVLGAFLPK